MWNSTSMFMVPGARAGGGAPDRGWNDASRPRPARGARGRPAPHTADGPDSPMAGAPDGSARPGPPGTGAAGTSSRGASAASSFFLVSARRKWLWACVTSARWREAGGAGRRAGLLRGPCTGGRAGGEVLPEVPGYRPPAHALRLPLSLSGCVKIGAWVCIASVG